MNKTKKFAPILDFISRKISYPFVNNENRARFKIILEIITLIVGITILITYYNANQLTKKALEINQKQIMISKVPWLNINRVSFDTENERISYYISNPSDSPALNVKSWVDIINNNDNTILNKKDNFEYENHLLSPKSEQRQYYKMQHPVFEIVLPGFNLDKLHIRITAQYEDVFLRKFSIIQSLQVSKDGKNNIIPLNVELTGIEQLK